MRFWIYVRAKGEQASLEQRPDDESFTALLRFESTYIIASTRNMVELERGTQAKKRGKRNRKYDFQTA